MRGRRQSYSCRAWASNSSTFVHDIERNAPSVGVDARQRRCNLILSLIFSNELLPFAVEGPRISFEISNARKPQRQETGELASQQPATCLRDDILPMCQPLVPSDSRSLCGFRRSAYRKVVAAAFSRFQPRIFA